MRLQSLKLEQKKRRKGLQEFKYRKRLLSSSRITGLLHDPVTWYLINYTGTKVTQWNFQNTGTRASPARLSFVLEVPRCKLRPSIIYSEPCDRIMQRAYSFLLNVNTLDIALYGVCYHTNYESFLQPGSL